MCNISIACLEELESIDDVIGSGSAKKTTRKPATPKAKPAAAAKKETEKKEPAVKTEKESTPTQKSKKITNLNTPKAKESTGTKTKQNEPVMSEAQKRAIFNLSRRRGISVETLEGVCIEDYGTTLENLSSSDASAFIRTLQQAA